MRRIKKKKHKRRYWSKKETHLLVSLYPATTAKEIAKKLRRPAVNVIGKARDMGLKKRKPLSKKEINFIKKSYKKMTYAELADKLGRNKNNMWRVLSRLKLQKKKKKSWTKTETTFIYKNYSTHHGYWLSARLKRSAASINAFARSLGLSKSVDFIHTLRVSHKSK